MSAKTILVPVDGASNIKLETLDFETLATVHSVTTETPAAQADGLAYNATGREFDWFDSIIQSLPDNTARQRWSRRSRAALRAVWWTRTTR